jgi:predicted MFS family arabinose efflux permease
LLVCSGAGSVCGALIIAAIEKAKGKERLTLFILISLGLITIGFALSKWLPLSCILIFLGGLAIMASASLMLSLAQLSATDAMRGRVMSVYNLAFRAGIPLGALALGRIIPVVGISLALSGAGAILVAISATFLLIRHNPQAVSQAGV